MSLLLDGAPALGNSLPIEAEVASLDETSLWLGGAYERVEMGPGGGAEGFVATGVLTSPGGSALQFTDRYSLGPDTGAVTLRRTVTATAVAEAEVAFNSRLRLFLPEGRGLRDLEVFVPGVWYGDDSHLPDTALASHYDDRFFMIREDRMPLPLVAARDKSAGTTFSLLLANSNPVTTMLDKGLGKRVIDPGMQFASLGVDNRDRPALALIFPGVEGERTYIWGAKANRERRRVALRSHPLSPGFSHEYEAVIRVGRCTRFADAVKQTWRAAYSLYSPEILPADVGRVYRDGIDILDTYWERSGGVPGFPFSVKVPSGEVDGRSLQMGFIGQQLPGAYYLIRHGLLMGDDALRAKGEAIVDFWSSRSLTDFGMPRVWWDVEPWNRWRSRYPTYVRIACEGMEGMLSAWRVTRQHERGHPPWLEACTRFGDWLVGAQNEDGSFYRSYAHDGEPGHRSKGSTIAVVRYLVELHVATSKERYLRSALRAGEFAWQDTHQPARYVGGTPDNPDVRDKEACLLALNGFLALFDLTGEQRWLDAACQAADFAETWQYCRHVPPLADEPRRTFPMGRKTTGLSIIATGHSGSDTFMSYNSFAFYRLHLHAGDRHYLRLARQLLHNTKQTLDWDGSLGYAHPGLQIEAGSVAPVRGSSVGTWLPWITVASIQPLASFQDAFGAMSIDEIERLPLEDRTRRNLSYARGRLFRPSENGSSGNASSDH
ncbi:MAG: hypothetical protein PVJ27_03145 [Candidatus Brocadiaceae bacterium]